MALILRMTVDIHGIHTHAGFDDLDFATEAGPAILMPPSPPPHPAWNLRAVSLIPLFYVSSLLFSSA